MTKIFQKSLASVLALALCLTALITASATVSAEEATTTATLYYEVSPEAPKKGDTVTVKLKANGFDTVAGADIYSTYSANITDGVLAWGLAEGQLGVNADVSHENNTIKMILEGASQNGVLDPITTLLADGTTLYTFTFTAGEAGTKYDFGFASDTKVRFCTTGEEKVDVTANAASVTVAEDEPEVTFTAPLKDKNVNTSFGLYAKFDFTFSGTAAEYGVMLYRAASYTDGMEVSIDTADMSAAIAPADWFSVSGFNITAITEKFVFVPYVKDTDAVYYYADPVRLSYAEIALERINNSSTKPATVAKLNAIFDAYYATKNAPAYDGQTAPAYTGIDKTATYADVTAPRTEANGEFSSPYTAIQGKLDNALYVKFDYSAYTGTAAEYGVLFYRAASYTDGMEVSIENADMSAAIKPTDWFSISGFNIAATGEQFAMVPYVKDNDGVYHYGSTSHVSYANYLVTKLTASTAAATSNRALALLDAYKAIYGKDLYTVSK